MKKALIFTLQYSDNYGTVLQAYALQEALKSLGLSAYIAPIMPKRPNVLRRFVGRTVNDTIQKIRQEYWHCRRGRFFKGFRSDWFDYGGLERICFSDVPKTDFSGFDALVYGSDNIWGAANRVDLVDAEVFFALHVNHPHKVAYAPSSGGNLMLDPLKGEICSLVKQGGFRHVSCREETSVRAFREHGINATKVPDPTLLLGESDWSGVEEPCDGEGVVFGYDMGHENQKSIRGICAELANGGGNVRIVYPNDWRRNEKEGCPMTPAQWVWSIHHAQSVVANSFHGIMFAIIFQRPFLYVPIVGRQERYNGRAKEMLKLCGLESREYRPSIDAASQMNAIIDWRDVEKRLSQFMAEGFVFLRKSI